MCLHNDEPQISKSLPDGRSEIARGMDMRTNEQERVEQHIAHELRDRINTELRDAVFKDVAALTIKMVARRVNAAGAFSYQFEVRPEFTWTWKRR